MNVLMINPGATPLLRREPSFDWLLALLIAGVLMAGFCAAINMTYQAAIIAFVVLAAIVAVVAGAAGLRWGFIFWIGALGIGYRTLTVTPVLKLHPAELMLWGLLFWSVIWAALHGRRHAVWLPWWVCAFIPFWIWGWLNGQDNGQRWDVMLAELRIFFLLIPLYMVASTILAQPKQWRIVLVTFYLIATGIATLGLVEYLYPGITALFPQFMARPEPAENPAEFVRASFSFWGGPAATYSCILAMPFAIPLWRWLPAFSTRLLTLASGLVLAGGIYVGGFRIFWLLLAMQCLLFLLLTRRYGWAIILILTSFAGFQQLPAATQERIHSLVQILRGRPVDSSGIKHLERPRAAIELAFENPAGKGWGAAGWVHSDFIQVAANLGIVAGLLFFAAWVTTMLRLWLCFGGSTRFHADAGLSLALLLSFLTAGGILATQAVIVAPQLALPVWFVWVLADILLRQEHTFRTAGKLVSG